MNKIQTNDDVVKAIQSGEDECLEIKSRIRDPKALAILISAFQNTQGGNIIIGANENGEILGVDRDLILNIYNRAKKLIEPYDISTLHFVGTEEGKDVAVIEVDATMTRVVGLNVNGISYERAGSQIVPITAKRIVQNIQSVLPPGSVELPHLSDLALKIEELNKNLIESGSWKAKAVDIIIGGVIGAIISIGIERLLK